MTDLEKDACLEVLKRVYDAEIKEEVEDQHYEPMVCQVSSCREGTMETRIRKLEGESSVQGKDMAELKSLVKDLCVLVKQEKEQGRRRVSGNVSDVKCYRCLEKGHFARDCRNEKACWKCTAKGHTYAECSQNPKNA